MTADAPEARGLAEVVLDVLARLELASATPREALAEEALWLALSNLGERSRGDLERLAAGRFWSADGAPVPPVLERVAAGLTLQRYAADPATGASERATAALACVALGCADPEAGQALQGGLGRLRLLEIVEQVPVAARIRALTLEFRHLPLTPDGPGVAAAFVARVEDLLEQLDRERLLLNGLEETPLRDGDADLRLQALIRSSSPRLVSLARVLLADVGPFPDAARLLAACLEDAPELWGRQRPDAARRSLETCYGQLRARLEGTPFALRPRAEGYGQLGG